MTKWIVPGLFAVAAAFAGAHAAETLAGAVSNPTARAGLVALYYSLRAGVAIAFVVCTVGRQAPVRRSREPVAFLACAAAMLLVLPIGGPGGDTATGLVLAGDLIAAVACVWLFASVLTLGRCFGVLPEARGLVVRGPYRLVRHPVYLGEIGALAGLTVASSAPWSIAVLGAVVAAQLARMRMEERALTAAFPEYGVYAAHTGRLLPRLRRYKKLPALTG